VASIRMIATAGDVLRTKIELTVREGEVRELL
jgi:hypothetical protein